MKYDYYQNNNLSKFDSCIYELNIRDATIKTNAINKGTYEALSHSLHQDYGLGYLKIYQSHIFNSCQYLLLVVLMRITKILKMSILSIIGDTIPCNIWYRVDF